MAAKANAAALDPLAAVLGHRFADPVLLETALTHPSATSPARPDNQRLEFLGDRVLGLVVAEALLAAFPGEAEGALAPRFNALVRRETLAEIALEIGLGGFLRLGRSEATGGGRRKAAILADALEAVIAALLLDGGMAAARHFILARWQGRIEAPETAPMDAKTRLQEWAQGAGRPLPLYTTTGEQGPAHEPEFEVEVSVEGAAPATGRGGSKRVAEQAAATALLAKVGPR